MNRLAGGPLLVGGPGPWPPAPLNKTALCRSCVKDFFNRPMVAIHADVTELRYFYICPFVTVVFLDYLSKLNKFTTFVFLPYFQNTAPKKYNFKVDRHFLVQPVYYKLCVVVIVYALVLWVNFICAFYVSLVSLHCVCMF